MTEKHIIQQCKAILKDHYGTAFRGMYLYGSTASGRGEAESDIDLLVLLAKPFDYFRELKTIVDILYPVQLESERLISAKPAAEDDFAAGTIHLYRVAGSEGTAA